jgi:hypothetical protein
LLIDDRVANWENVPSEIERRKELSSFRFFWRSHHEFTS